MSYSFNVSAATKAEAKAKVEAEFDKVLEYQPIHARDKGAALANAGAVIDLLVDDDTMDVHVSCSGYVAGSLGEGSEASLHLASVSAIASLAKRLVSASMAKRLRS